MSASPIDLVILQINHGKLKAYRGKANTGRVITSKKQLDEYSGCTIAFSSTLDFPEEFTKSAAVLRLVRSINK